MPRPRPLAPRTDPPALTPLPGAQLRYFVHVADGLLMALLGFSTTAWKTAPQDRFVGQDPATRLRSLPLVVNHPRYLILPRNRLPCLASSANSRPTGTSASASARSC